MGKASLVGTWIDSEELAYSSPDGGLRGSKRQGLVRLPNGKLGKVILAIPDTAFTIPARTADGTVGYVDVLGEEYNFHPYTVGSPMYLEYAKKPVVHRRTTKAKPKAKKSRAGTSLGGMR